MMKHLNYCCVAVLLSASMNAQAGLFSRHIGCDDTKCCDCAPSFQPRCCKPVIVRPCQPNVYSHQRQRCTAKPPCCDSCGAPNSCCRPRSRWWNRRSNVCCDTGAGCCDAGNACCDSGNACCDAGSAGGACCAPKACCPLNGCDAGNGCAAPCDPGCASPCASDACCDDACAPGCAAPAGCGCGYRCGRLFGRLFHCGDTCCDSCDAGDCCDPGCASPCATDDCCDPGCAAPRCCLGGGHCGGLFGRLFHCGDNCCDSCDAGDCCDSTNACDGCGTGCGRLCGHGLFGRLFDRCGRCCDACDGSDCCDACDNVDCCPSGNSCRIAELIYESQTACYARQRKWAVRKLGRYDCVCHPEVMCALIYALNDADPYVRYEAATEIDDQIRKNRCCCNQKVVSALTCALGDCHRPTVREAKRALERCGYDVVRGNCGDGCDACCDASGANGSCCDANGGCCDANGCAPATVAPVAPMAPAQPAPAEPAPADNAVPTPAPEEKAPEAYVPRPLPTQTSMTSRTERTLAKVFTDLF